MQKNSLKELKKKRVAISLKNNLKKRKIFQKNLKKTSNN
jgi:hypothetical protein